MKWLLLLILPIVAEMEPMAVFHHEPQVEKLLENKILGVERQVTTIQGYRVQVYSSTDVQTGQIQAYAVERQVRESGMGVATYVQFNAPFWKVRLGDFRTMQEAETLRKEVLRLFPEWEGMVNVIRDEVTIIR